MLRESCSLQAVLKIPYALPCIIQRDNKMKQFLTGNILLIVCCAFYLAWWIIAFKPAGAVKGIKSGWLLIPAAACGLLAVILICRAIASSAKESRLIPVLLILIIAAAAYFILLALSWFIMKRKVTTELFLIVGWAALAAAQISALYGYGSYTKTAAMIFIAAIIIMAAVSMVCYLLYYNLDSVKGYIDGMIPLIIVMVMTAAIAGTVLSG